MVSVLFCVPIKLLGILKISRDILTCQMVGTIVSLKKKKRKQIELQF